MQTQTEIFHQWSQSVLFIDQEWDLGVRGRWDDRILCKVPSKMSTIHLLFFTPQTIQRVVSRHSSGFDLATSTLSQFQITLSTEFSHLIARLVRLTLLWSVISINGCYDVQLNFNYSIMNGVTVGSKLEREEASSIRDRRWLSFLKVWAPCLQMQLHELQLH